LKVKNSTYALPAELALYCGLREDEIAGLKGEHVDKGQKLLHITGKGGRYRTVPIPENLLNQLQLPLQLGPQELEKYLGKPIFYEDKQQAITKPGLAIGLAWTPLGGATLTIEAVANPGKEGFRLTGQLGDVMQESASIAYTYVRQIAARFGINKDFFENNQIHLHIPAGATPKDGPSAGITMCTALLSLVLNKKIKPAVAMTGELSLIGRVLPSGGLKEKVIAARRQQIKEIIIPVENQKDLEEIQDYIKKGIQFHPVSTMEEVLKLVFPKLKMG
jgi:ATP-dependent Lon protease